MVWLGSLLTCIEKVPLKLKISVKICLPASWTVLWVQHLSSYLLSFPVLQSLLFTNGLIYEFVLQCFASLTMLGCLLGLQTIYIDYLHFYFLLVNYIHLSALLLLCLTCKIWPFYLFCVLFQCCLRKYYLNMSNGITLLSVPIPTLYSILALFCLLLVSNFVLY